MRFTRRTYKAAVRRAFDLELYFYRGWCAGFCGPHKYRQAVRTTNLLLARRKKALGF
ncbi:hypothetical protein SEA_MOLEFICENT_54 [Microbacterium phage Moleficent]|uniref:Uncharacterized protein n=5 Tax=Akonivirus phedro TaxID=2845594 RepID=A0A6M3T3Q8_9CAUD|nr:hypothetical protein HWD33_gp53 [Microbacterium phage Phedro]QFG04976.1 hypothetical protein SEA_PHRIEDRICE_54 [Microbacterium phage PhriedRice]QJD52905.1 hypothetical protein SEA_PHRACTURED_53 [Microbacterium phage Phractured]QJD53015.1 hypothetical protein SEA_PHARKY_53 [Microbacterium phage Pharky]QWY82745.1 hypothetical protein SEA_STAGEPHRIGHT_53 [Microbacterium phage StagePhright]UXE04142.1 hypothetical protein Fullmetal_53 [Microbacterium phage Fullmetal]WNM74558.1 hypothetical prot